VVGTAFAILLAFIIVDAFQTYSGPRAPPTRKRPRLWRCSGRRDVFRPRTC